VDPRIELEFLKKKKIYFPLHGYATRLIPGRSPVTILTMLSRLPYFALFAKYFSGEKLRKMRWTRHLVLIEEREGCTGCW